MSKPPARIRTEPSEASTLCDGEVVARVLAGDIGLFEILLRRHNLRIYRVACGMLRDEAEAEDVTQQAYVAAYSHLCQWQGRAQFGSWLARIAVHETLARARKRRRERAGSRRDAEEDVLNTATSSEPTPEQQALQHELRTHLDAAIESLPLLYRVAFVMRHVDGLSTADTATGLGVRVDAVKARLSRARALLRKDLYRRIGGGATVTCSIKRKRSKRVATGTRVTAVELPTGRASSAAPDEHAAASPCRRRAAREGSQRPPMSPGYWRRSAR